MARRARGGGSPVAMFVVAAVALVMGLALGGLGPRSELRALRTQLEALQDGGCKGSGVGREIASAFAGRPWQPDDGQLEGQRSARKDDDGVRFQVGDAPPPDADDGTQVRFDFGNGKDAPDREDVEEGLDLARDAMALRRRQAYAALEEGAAPDDGQMQQIEEAIADMNSDLHVLAEEFVASVQDGQEPSRRDAMLFASETLDVLLDADDRIFETLSPEQVDASDPQSIDPMSYVDPSLIDVFMELDRE